MNANRPLRWCLLASLVLTVAAVALIRARVLPTGVPGEWHWEFVPFAPGAIDVVLAGAGVLAYAAFVAMGSAALERDAGRTREALWVAALTTAAFAAQGVAQSGGPVGHGLAKWSTLALPGSSGYFEVARTQMADPWRFWADYPRWIRDQDALHIGTHPPGLFLASRGLLGFTTGSPGAAGAILAFLPESADRGIRAFVPGLGRAERAAIVAIGGITWLLCAATVAPLYALARATLPAGAAWAAAALWPLAPSAVMFQPTADTAFPFLATLAVALAARGGLVGAAASGVALAVGMQFSLVFLPVGLVVAIVHLARAGQSRRRRAARVLATGAGFLGLTGLLWAVSGANPFVIWWWNQKNHARFYETTRLSYAAWVVADPIELVVALGVPSALFAAVGFGARRASPAAWGALAVLAVLDLSGKNLSEVARLWMPFMPMLLVASGAGWQCVSGGRWSLAAVVALIGAESLALQATIQVVYPAIGRP